jgi:hypothetical protein
MGPLASLGEAKQHAPEGTVEIVSLDAAGISLLLGGIGWAFVIDELQLEFPKPSQ